MARYSKRPLADIPQWSQRIKQARERAGLVQTKLSEAINISQKTLSDWELGKTEPDLAEFNALATATGVDPAWLLLGREPSDSDAMLAVVAEAEKQNRQFAWTFHQAARMFAEEGIDANLSYLITYVQQILATTHDSTDQSNAQERIARKLEAERLELRQDLDKIRKNRLQPR